MIKNALIGQKAERDAFLKGNYVPREGELSARAALANTLRNGDEITSPTMHHSFRPPLPDLKSQKYQNSPLFHQLL